MPDSGVDIQDSFGEQLIKQLRICVNPPGRKASCLRDLSDRHLFELFAMLRHGRLSVAKLAKTVQDQWAYHKTVHVKTIETAIRKFREAAVPLLEQAPEGMSSDEKKELAVVKRNARERLNNHVAKIDSLGTLRWATQELVNRCIAWKELEKTHPLEPARKDLKLLVETCERLVRLEMDLGVRDRQPNELIITQHHQFEALLGVLPDNGEAFAHAAGTFLEGLQDSVLTLEAAEDGTFSIRERTDAERVSDLALGVCGGLGVRPGTERQDLDQGIECLAIAAEILPSDRD